MSSIGSYELVLPHLMHLAFSNAVINIFENFLATCNTILLYIFKISTATNLTICIIEIS